MPLQNLNQHELSELVDVACGAISDLMSEDKLSPPDLTRYSTRLTTPAGCFVTLKVSGQLQGCLGIIQPGKPLVAEIHDKAIASACHDHRFAPLTKEQLGQLTVEVSVLSPPQSLNVESEQALLNYLQAEKPGLILSEGHHQALFLPQVWEQLPEPKAFVEHLKRKAGWRANYWSEGISVKIFSVASLEKSYPVKHII